jgi:holo-[acyl-carrier-protein] synthase
MIYGVGMDVVEPHRVRRPIEKYRKRYPHCVLTGQEWRIYRVFFPVLFIENRFSDTEACSKVMRTGFRYSAALQFVSIVQLCPDQPGTEFRPVLAQSVCDAKILARAYVGLETA